MLLQLLVHQPQALGQIIQQTPYWVWGLLAALVWLGASQLFDRTASLVRVVVMPVAMTGFSIYGLASAFGGAGHTGGAVGAWMAAATAATCLALWFQPTAPAGTLYDSGSRCFQLPGSAMPLALILGIFLTKYLVGVELAMQPALARDGSFALQIAALYGVFNGLFAARSLRLWRLVRSSAGLASQAASA
ncbi:hypothetical protein ASF11_20575 [Acidovorax sp. Leaf76]|uniref:DUF6622 family protein n=1 Tax=unclassified Acidovorax TaxID=2684926 RepID=UPI000701662B|nr:MULTISPECIES: DUF6622 family protein [unclassified Acidovorax]KQO24726.1 hypothetical protein ASF11_20575 [Acidovorax sp. Leaf76]KQO39731.1 hypothetical protein ASF19_18510 [Acidovorax sp. Leaf84]KQS25020.1 hypothetical protein ASG27_19925 [Acidovorax sp. Leaf191]